MCMSSRVFREFESHRFEFLGCEFSGSIEDVVQDKIRELHHPREFHAVIQQGPATMNKLKTRIRKEEISYSLYQIVGKPVLVRQRGVETGHMKTQNIRQAIKKRLVTYDGDNYIHPG